MVSAPPVPTGPDAAVIVLEEIKNLYKNALSGTGAGTSSTTATHTSAVAAIIGTALHVDSVK